MKSKEGATLRIVVFVGLLVCVSTCFSADYGETDYWSDNKTMNLPLGVATTSCDFYNKLDQADEHTALMNEIYKRWLKGWVSSFAMYSDWGIRDIAESEYLIFLQEYCGKFPSNTIGMAAHTFTFRVKTSPK